MNLSDWLTVEFPYKLMMAVTLTGVGTLGSSKIGGVQPPPHPQETLLSRDRIDYPDAGWRGKDALQCLFGLEKTWHNSFYAPNNRG